MGTDAKQQWHGRCRCRVIGAEGRRRSGLPCDVEYPVCGAVGRPERVGLICRDVEEACPLKHAYHLVFTIGELPVLLVEHRLAPVLMTMPESHLYAAEARVREVLALPIIAQGHFTGTVALVKKTVLKR